MAIQREQGPFKGERNGGTTIQVSLGSPPQNGNVLIACIGNYCSDPSHRIVTGITQTGVTWSLAKAGDGYNSYSHQEIWIGIVGAEAGTLITVTFSAYVFYGVIDACEYSGIDITNPIDVSAYAHGVSDVTYTGITASTSQATELWIGNTIVQNYGQISPQNGFTLLDGVYTGSWISIAYLEKIVSAIGTAWSGTTSNPDNWCFWDGCVVCLKGQTGPVAKYKTYPIDVTLQAKKTKTYSIDAILAPVSESSLIYSMIQSINTIDWAGNKTTGHDLRIFYAGGWLGIYTVSDFVAEINYQNSLATVDGYDTASNLRIIADALGFSSTDLDTATKATMDGFSILGGVGPHLPVDGLALGTIPCVCSGRGGVNLYKLAKLWNYDASKWNSLSAISELESIIDTFPMCTFYDASNNSYICGGRSYDEAGQWLDFMIKLYEADPINNVGALTYVINTLWDWYNTGGPFGTGFWNPTGSFYSYGRGNDQYECEGAFFPLIFARMRADNGYSLAHWNDRVIVDIYNRWLLANWAGHGWIDYVVEHSTSNTQHRLSNTVGAWFTLQAYYQVLDSTPKANMIAMLAGTGSPAIPAWSLIEQYSTLYHPLTHQWSQSGEAGSDSMTAIALQMLFLLGIVPSTGSLFSPLQEFCYECFMNFDNDWHLDIANRKITIPVKAGNLTFIYGSYPVTQNFDHDGVYEITFASDWNSIDSMTRVRPISMNKTYVNQPTVSSINVPYYVDTKLIKRVNVPISIDFLLSNYLTRGRTNAVKNSLMARVKAAVSPDNITIIDAWRMPAYDYDTFTGPLCSVKINLSRQQKLSYGEAITNGYGGTYWLYNFSLHVIARYEPVPTGGAEIESSTAFDFANRIVSYLRKYNTDRDNGVLDTIQITARESDPSGGGKAGAHMARIIVEGYILAERPWRFHAEAGA